MEKKLKIVFLSAYQDSVGRGGEVFVNELSVRLSRRHLTRVIGGGSTSVTRWPVMWRFFLDPSGLGVLLFTLLNLKEIWAKKYDIVVPLNGGWQTMLVRAVTKLYGGKMVVSGQSGIGWDDKVNIWNFPSAFVALSRHHAKWAKRANPFVRVEKIPNGVSVEEFSKKIKPVKLDLARPVILSVGALVPGKRHELTIKAMSKIDKGTLVIAGDGDSKHEIERLGKKIIPGRLELLKLKHSQMPGLYAAADLFVYPTVPWESFGIVLVEAMASGLPVVATVDPIRREIVGDAGIFVDPNDTDAYAEAIQKALKIKWGSKPRRQAEKFKWDDIAKEYEKLFLELVK